MKLKTKRLYLILSTTCLIAQLATSPRVLAASPDALESGKAVEELASLLAVDPVSKGLIRESIATIPLTKEDALKAASLLAESFKIKLRNERAAEMAQETLKHGEHEMPFFTKVFGEKPEGGRSLYISMHGGGGAPTRVNDRQWENQKTLYSLEEGVYVAPRAPTDTWNLWHQGHIDPLFERLIQNMVVFHDVNPDRVYLMGYSAGGDGVYQLAPRMADYFGAAAMMAGHPNETTAHGLRNLPFSLFMGGKDAAYKRNQIAEEWKGKLSDLQSGDPEGYEHWVEIFPDFGHWMQKEDAVAIPWMHKFTRNKYPDRIVWKQDDVLHDRFYWLRLPANSAKARSLNVVSRKGQVIQIEKAELEELVILLNDSMVNLDQPVIIQAHGKTLFKGQVNRTIANLIESLLERGDPSYLFSGTIELQF
jgi:hypothetical protein